MDLPTVVDAALRIQCLYRRFRAKKIVQRLRANKKMNDLIEKLQQDAYIMAVKKERKRLDKMREKEEEEKRRRILTKQQHKRILEASFDGNLVQVGNVLREIEDQDTAEGLGEDAIGRCIRNRHLYDVVNCADANGNTPISEASAGGHPDIIEFLASRGADPNRRGMFGRTPIYRAAFAGHVQVVEKLLYAGADPRLYAEDGFTPQQVASDRMTEDVISHWDLTITDRVLQRIAEYHEKREKEDRIRIEIENAKYEYEVEMIEKEYAVLTTQMERAQCELSRRETEFEKGLARQMNQDVLTKVVMDAEDELARIKLNRDQIREKLAQARLQLREKRKELKDGMKDMSWGFDGVSITIRELDDVLFRDVGNRIADSGRWPFVLDLTDNAVTFLRYRDTNYVNCLNPQHINPHALRIALLGAIRYGKPFVIDFMDMDFEKSVQLQLNLIATSLWDDLLTKKILLDENYLSLVHAEDGDEYNSTNFVDSRMKNFMLIIITSNAFPSENLMSRMYPIKVDPY